MDRLKPELKPQKAAAARYRILESANAAVEDAVAARFSSQTRCDGRETNRCPRSRSGAACAGLASEGCPSARPPAHC